MQRPVSSIRSVLAGFVGLLILMGCLAVDSARQTRDVSMTSAALRKESRDRDARDYMLEHDEVLAAGQKAELQLLQSRVEQALNQHKNNVPPKEREAVASLQQHAESYWASMAPALDWNRTTRREQGEMFLHNTIIPRRDEVVQFTNQVNALDGRLLDAAEERLQILQARFQSRVGWISISALALGSILAIVVVRRAQRLGVEAETRFKELSAAREDLRRLSDRLFKVQEEERRSLSRELHDDLGQAMSAILIELGNLESALAGAQVHWDGFGIRTADG
jgi:signal transduction histidine kinase